MRKISLFAALVVAMTAVSCVKENAFETVDGPVAFTAEFTEASTKAVLKPGETSSKVEWLAGDEVSVFAEQENHKFTAGSAGAVTDLTTSDNVATCDKYYAVYPYNEAATIAESVITTVLPAEQVAVKGSFATHLAVAQSVSNKFAFKNVCGLVKVNVSSDNVTKVVFEGNSGEVVAGGIAVTVADAPSWAAVAEQGATSVTLLPAEGKTTIEAGDYYFAVLPQTFAAGFKVTSHKNDGYAVVRNVDTEVVVARSGMVAGKSFGISGKGTEAEPYVLMTVQDMLDMRTLAKLGGETWFKLGADIDMKGVTTYVPVNFDEEFERKIHFDGDNHTIDNFYNNNPSYASLFGVLYGSLKNLKVTNAVIEGKSVCGVIAGYAGTTDKPAEVENVTVTNATVTSTTDRAGGICGNAKGATMKNVSFQGSVTTTTTADAKSGGFVGQVESSTFTGCSADAVLKGATSDLGGFAGKTAGTVSFTDCNVKISLETSALTKNRAGGFIGWNAAPKTTITNCHVLAGSTITDISQRTAQGNADIGGFIGYADTAEAVVVIDGCSVNAEVTVAKLGLHGGGLIGTCGYASNVTIRNTSVSGKLSVVQNYSGGFIGYMSALPTITITGCHYSGSITGASGVGGILGGVEGGTANVSKTYVTGNITPTAHNCGGIVGLSNGPVTIENCWSDVVITQAAGQFGAGIAGGVQKAIIIRNCYSLGQMNVSRGAGGIVGQVKNVAPEVTGCIAWGGISTKRGATQYSPGAIVGNIQIDGKYMKCYRKHNMEFSDVAMKLVDHEDVENGRPPLATYEGDVAADKNQYAYHGKAAAADATVSSVAKSLGWDETVWDLSGSLPVFKK